MQVIITLSEEERELARQSAAWMINAKNSGQIKNDRWDGDAERKALIAAGAEAAVSQFLEVKWNGWTSETLKNRHLGDVLNIEVKGTELSDKPLTLDAFSSPERKDPRAYAYAILHNRKPVQYEIKGYHFGWFIKNFGTLTVKKFKNSVGEEKETRLFRLPQDNLRSPMELWAISRKIDPKLIFPQWYSDFAQLRSKYLK